MATDNVNPVTATEQFPSAALPGIDHNENDVTILNNIDDCSEYWTWSNAQNCWVFQFAQGGCPNEVYNPDIPLNP